MLFKYLASASQKDDKHEHPAASHPPMAVTGLPVRAALHHANTVKRCDSSLILGNFSVQVKMLINY